MAIKYSDITDPQNLTKIIGADYQNEARTVQSGIVRREGFPMEGTHVSWLKETLFSGDDTGQGIGVDTEIQLKSKVQAEYQLPLVWRADGAELDDVSEAIMAKRTREGMEADLANAISAKASQMLDTVAVKIIDGAAAFIQTNGTNYNNQNGNQITLVTMEETKSKRGDRWVDFDGGFIICRGIMASKLGALGMVAATSNTLGNMHQDQIVKDGVVGTILGMNVFPTDKIALDSGGTDHLVSFVEAGALRMLIGQTPDIDPFIRQERAFKTSVKFRIQAGGVIDGLSWSGSKVNPAQVGLSDLATGTNYELAKTNIKNVPMAVGRWDAPTF
jgi:hypothetical protein